MCSITARAQIVLPTSPEAPALAREFARSSGCSEHALEVMDDALLLISEVVTNSLLHGGPPIVLAIECDGEGLQVRVRDGSADLPKPRRATEDDEGGRGLTLVDMLTDAWGVEPVSDEHGPGKQVWFELRPSPQGHA